jgi:putative sterol carrier protein
MNDPTVEFFQTLSRRGSEPMLGNVTAAIRFDISLDRKTKSWRVAIDGGRLTVSPAAAAAPSDDDDADCVIAAEKTCFDDIAAGGVNAMAALLRGEIAVSGDPELVVAVQRLFPTSGQAAYVPRTSANFRLPDDVPPEEGIHDER